MRILWVTTFPPRRCGIADYASDLAAAVSRTGHAQLRILTYPDGERSGVTEGDGYEVSRGLGRVFARRRIIEEISTFQPDTIHLQSTSLLHPPVVNRGIVNACQVPMVTTVHDTPKSRRLFYAVPSLRLVYEKSDRLLVHSSDVSRTLSTYHGIRPEKIVTLPHGVDLDSYSPRAAQDEALRQYGLDGTRMILFFGFMRPGKGLETLLHAWAAIESSYLDTILVIAGGAPTKARRYHLLLRSEANYPGRIRTLAADLGIANRVLFTGYVPASLTPGLLASSDVAVLPYEGGIAQSGPLHKVLASGCAIVASDVRGLREMLVNGKDGILVPPRNPTRLGEALSELLSDPARAREMGKKAREKSVHSLSWTVIAENTLNLYRALV